MKAIQISGTNFKGQTFTHDLAPITIFCGENAAGKSARGDVIELAMIGYLRRLGKLPSATWKLSSGTEMEAEIAYANSKRTIDLSSSARFWDVRGAIKSEVKLAFETPGILMDVRDYFGRSGPERRKYLFNLASSGTEFKAEAVVAKLRTIRLEPHPESADAVIDAVVEEFKFTDAKRKTSKWDLDEFFTVVVGKFKTALSDSNAIAKQFRGSIQAGVSLATGNVIRSEVETELQEARAKVTDYTGRLATAKASVEENERNHAAKTAAQVELDANPLIEDDLASYITRGKAAKEALAAVTFDEDTAQENWTAREDLLGQKTKLESEIQWCETGIADREGKLKGHCPRCGADSKHWSKEIRKAVKSELVTMTDLLADAKAKLVHVNDAIAGADILIQKDQNNRVAFAGLQKTYSEAKLAYDNRKHVIEARRDLHLAAQNRHTSVVVMDEDRLYEWISDKLGWVISPEPAPEGKVKTLLKEFEAAIATIVHDVAILEREQRENMRIRAEAANQQNARDALKLAEVKSEVYKAVVAILTTEQDVIIAGGIGDVMSRASALTSAVMGFPLEFRDGDIGYFRGPIWVDHSTFSGTEQSLAYAGLSLAFAQHAPCRLMLIDELGRLTKGSARRLMAGVSLLIEKGLLDNFVGFAPDADVYEELTNKAANISVIKV